MTNKKPLLILLAAGSASGKGTLISKIKKNQLLSDNKICQIGTDDYVTVRVKEESRIGEIVYGFEGTGRFGGASSGSGLSNRQKKEINENVQVYSKLCRNWYLPENFSVQALKQKIKDELNEQNSNNIIIVEGVHALQFDEIRELADLKIWIQNDDDLRLIRKIIRSPYYQKLIGGTPEDTRDYGGTLTPFPNAFKCWTDGDKPGEKSHILPTKKYADLVVFSNDWEEFDKGVEKVASIINLYFEDEEEFKKELAKEKRGRIEGEISELEEQIKDKKIELSKLVTEQTTNYQQQQAIIQQPPK